MFMHHWLVIMPMPMRISAVPRKIVRVVVMLVMPVRMAMIKRHMHVLVFVPLPQMQPDPECHQDCGRPERYAWSLRPNQERDQHPEQWGNGKVCSSSSGIKSTQPHYEERKTNTIASESDQHRTG